MTERTLVSVEDITSVSPIEGADAIESVQVRNWNVVVRKGEFQSGDKVVYIEVDAALPLVDSRFEFLGPRGTKRFTGEIGVERDVHVLKTARLRGVYSQGIVFPLDEFPEVRRKWEDWDFYREDHILADLDSLLGIEKWEPPIPQEMNAIAPFPSFLQKTDAERVQNITRETWEEIQSQPEVWEAVEKIDGSSLTAWKCLDGVLHVASRKWELDPKSENTHWRAAKSADLKNILHPGEWVQGEVAGPGVHGNSLGLKDLRLFVFGFGTTDFSVPTRLPRHQWGCLKDLAAPVVDLTLPKTIEETVSQVESFKSVISPGRGGEGVVWTHREGTNVSSLDRHVFKSISAKYLLKHDR